LELRYRLWVNDYGEPNIGGRIVNWYTPSEASCPLSNGQYCKVTPNVRFSPGGGDWWLTAFFHDEKKEHLIVDGLRFSIR
jgi:hypothetical protein